VSSGVVRMPRLSDSMSEATVVAWLKQPGEGFSRGEPLVEVETDKATVVYEAEADGVLGEILVPEGGTAALGEPIARLQGAGGGAMGDSLVATSPGIGSTQAVDAPAEQLSCRGSIGLTVSAPRRSPAEQLSSSVSGSRRSWAQAQVAAFESSTSSAPDRRHRSRPPRQRPRRRV
jgi:pyruvate/2-oxoglutarate dehydrogenase complex dihydrolipoamide acyltransferase (E2) component